MVFKIGDKAVYPAHGVAEIKRVESKSVAGIPTNFYVLEILGSGALVMVPVDTSEKAGIRELVNSEDISSIYHILKNPNQVSQRTWNRRFREFSAKMRTGSAQDVAEVLRDLWTLKSMKELSYGEKKMLEKSKEMIVSEISAARAESTVSVENEIDHILAD